MTDAERFERVVMMSGGRFVCQGSPTELVTDLGAQLLGIPSGTSVTGIGIPWELQADGSRIAKPANDAELASWSAELAGAGVPFFVRKPTLADAYLHWAEAPLEAEVPAWTQPPVEKPDLAKQSKLLGSAQNVSGWQSPEAPPLG